MPSAYSGAGYFDRGPDEDKPKAEHVSFSLKKIEKVFLEGKYEEVVDTIKGYSARGSKLDDDSQYLMGRALLKLGRFSEARDYFSNVVNYSKGDKLLDKAYIGLADSYYLENDYEKAIEHYEKVLRYFPDSDDMPIVYYKLGDCYAKTGDRSKSNECNDKLLSSYPDSLEAKLVVVTDSEYVTYSVQVGSFKEWKNAERLNDELKRQGFDVNIFTTAVDDSRFYRVRVGQYSNRSDAEDMARTLLNKGYDVKIYP